MTEAVDLTAEEVLRGVAHIKRGELFTLQRLIGDPNGDPVWPGRTPAQRTMVFDESSWDEGGDGPSFPGGLHYAEDKMSSFLQGSTQYDALGHVWFDNLLWNGYDSRTTIGGLSKASVAPIAERGVAGRAILLDMARFRGKGSLDARETYTHEDLEACAAAQGITIEKRDIIIIRTNHLQRFFEKGDAFYEDFCESGLVYSPELVQWFQDKEVPNLVTDTIANEVTHDPNNGAALVLHNALMRNLGIAFTEICDLEKLAADCAEDGVYSLLLRCSTSQDQRSKRRSLQPGRHQMSVYSERPWLPLYSEGLQSDIVPNYTNGLDLFLTAVASGPDDAAIIYFDTTLTFRQLDESSTALAAGLIANGFGPSERLALYVQNNPAFVIGLIAAWKAAGAAVSINPMNKGREVTSLLKDSGATALLALDDLYASVAREVIATGTTDVHTVVTVSALDGQTRDDPRLFAGVERVPEEGTLDLTALIKEYPGAELTLPSLGPDDLAILTYTWGTTGVPKGAMNSHGNLAFNAQTYRDWTGLRPGEPVLGIAPLFHITGLVGHVMFALLTPSPLVLTHRFQADVMLDSIREHKPVLTIGAITALVALAGADGAKPDDFASLRIIYSGGAPIAPALGDRLQKTLGHYIHNVYGLTETSSPTHAVPLGRKAPVDPTSGALSVGVPVFNTFVRVIDEEGNDVPVGEVGEFATSGPQVVAGYWGKPEATAESIPGGELRTGDVGFMNSDGWYFLVDRKKDMINASGYKVWPREVEDVLYGHPSVREAAVIGVPDECRGETVKAFVSFEPGAAVTEEELISFCKEQMAGYKYPRQIEIIDELPKTVTGKILRRELRDQQRA